MNSTLNALASGVKAVKLVFGGVLELGGGAAALGGTTWMAAQTQPQRQLLFLKQIPRWRDVKQNEPARMPSFLVESDRDDPHPVFKRRMDCDIAR